MLTLRDIGKSFGGVPVLRGVSLDVAPGKVLGLLGANGAGKSTLVKVLTGSYPAFEGEVQVNGAKVVLRDPASARRLGIDLVPQEVDTGIFPELSVAENLTFDDVARGGFGMWVNRRQVLENARGSLSSVGLSVHLDSPARELSLHQRLPLQPCRSLTYGGVCP